MVVSAEDARKFLAGLFATGVYSVRAEPKADTTMLSWRDHLSENRCHSVIGHPLGTADIILRADGEYTSVRDERARRMSMLSEEANRLYHCVLAGPRRLKWVKDLSDPSRNRWRPETMPKGVKVAHYEELVASGLVKCESGWMRLCAVN